MPSGDQARLRTSCLCPLSVFLADASPLSPFATSQTKTMPVVVPVAKRAPSGLNRPQVNVPLGLGNTSFGRSPGIPEANLVRLTGNATRSWAAGTFRGRTINWGRDFFRGMASGSSDVLPLLTQSGNGGVVEEKRGWRIRRSPLWRQIVLPGNFLAPHNPA